MNHYTDTHTMGNQNNPMGGGMGRGGPSEEEREAERKRRMEERK